MRAEGFEGVGMESTALVGESNYLPAKVVKKNLAPLEEAAPPPPTVTVVDNCDGTSTLTASDYTGDLLWSTGETSATIIVTTAGEYTVTQNVDTETSAPAKGTAAPKTTPPAPTVTVVDNCNSTSTLTASDYTGDLLWSTGETSAVITVSTAGDYTVTQTVNGCPSPAATGTAAPKTQPAMPSAEDGRRCGPGTVTLEASGAVVGESYRWYTADEVTINDSNGDPVVTANYTTPELTSNSTTTFLVSVVGTNGCESDRREVQAITNVVPAMPTAEDGRRCGPGTVELVASGGTENGYRWYTADSDDAIITDTNGNPVVTASYTTPELSVSTTYYVSVVNADNCESERRGVQAIINALPPEPSITNIKTTYFTNEPSVTFTGDPTGGKFSLDGSAGVDVLSFDPCTVGVGNHKVRYTVTDANGCSNFKEYEITVKQSTYTVVITAAPFPICRGQKTNYVAQVYRNAEVIYPYLENPADIKQDDPNTPQNEAKTTYNPAYDPYLPAEADPIHKLYPARFFQPVVISGELMPVNDFTYQWTKNEKQNIGSGKDKETLEQAGLSSSDFYKVYVTENTAKSCVTTISKQLSNPMYISEPDGYTMSLSLQPTTICKGDNVTFTASLGSGFQWEAANLQMSWKLRRSGTVYNIKNASGISDLQLSSAEIRAALTNLNVTPAELITGDEIFVEFVTDLESILPADSKCNSKQTSLNPVKVTVNQPVTFDDQVLVEKVVCAGTAVSFSPNPVPTGTNLQYQWYHNGNLLSGATLETYSIPSAQKANEGTYSLGVTNLCTTTEIRRDIGTLAVKDLAVFSLSGTREYCDLYPENYPISLSGSESGVNYTLMLTPEGGTAQVVETKAGTGSGITFSDQSAEGTYTVAAQFATAPACPKDMNGTFTINVIQSTTATGELEIWWVEENGVDMWEVTAISNHSSFSPPVTNLTFEWYKYDEASGGWMETPFAITTVDSVLVEPETTVKAVVKSPASSCVKDLILDFNPAALPVEIFAFNAEQQNGHVVLSWSTAMEKDNTGFEIQVSTDAKNYKTIAFVETKNGDTNSIQEYSFTDLESGMQGSLYYRLKQIDIDGAATYYGPVYIEVKSRSAVSFYPNPFTEELTAEVIAEGEGEVILYVTNTLGARLLQKTIKVKEGLNTEQLLLDPSLKSGVYFVFIRMNGISRQYKLMKQ